VTYIQNFLVRDGVQCPLVLRIERKVLWGAHDIPNSASVSVKIFHDVIINLDISFKARMHPHMTTQAYLRPFTTLAMEIRANFKVGSTELTTLTTACTTRVRHTQTNVASTKTATRTKDGCQHDTEYQRRKFKLERHFQKQIELQREGDGNHQTWDNTCQNTEHTRLPSATTGKILPMTVPKKKDDRTTATASYRKTRITSGTDSPRARRIPNSREFSLTRHHTHTGSYDAHGRHREQGGRHTEHWRQRTAKQQRK
jgi:hypothetical protein